MITISLVSHGHGPMVSRLVEQLLECATVSHVIITLNLPEKVDLPNNDKIEIVVNQHPKGFSSNHNSAFSICSSPYFCVINPDIILCEDPFPRLLATMKDHKAALCAPRVLAPSGTTEDSIRYFPTVRSLCAKVWYGAEGRFPLPDHQEVLFPDWVAGMFMLFYSNAFRAINNFDEDYFLYYEDVDICARLHKAHQKIVANRNVSVVHDAQRESRKNLTHMRWHLTSMMRYLLRHGRF